MDRLAADGAVCPVLADTNSKLWYDPLFSDPTWQAIPLPDANSLPMPGCLHTVFDSARGPGLAEDGVRLDAGVSLPST
jgi:hypothetical protein